MKAARGAVRLVKIDIDQNQDLAAAAAGSSRCQRSIAFFQGRPVDGFVGDLPDSQVQSFVKRLAEATGGQVGPSPIDQALEQAQMALDQNQVGAASALYGQILAAEPENVQAIAGTIRCRLLSGDAQGAKDMLEGLPEETKRLSEISAVAAAIELELDSGDAGDLAALHSTVSANPNDHQARFDLAMALYAAGQMEAGATSDRFTDAMKIVTSQDYCVKCHIVGDYNPTSSDRAKAPDLARVYRRLRPDYLRRWIANPASILPYTAMPVNIKYDPDAPNLGTAVPQDLYHGNSVEQVDALVDLLMNFDRYARERSKIAPLVKPAKSATTPAAGGD